MKIKCIFDIQSPSNCFSSSSYWRLMLCFCSYTDGKLSNQKCTNRHFRQNETTGREESFINRKPLLVLF